jgi:hypothetical protein
MSNSHVSQFRKKSSVANRSPSPIGHSRDQIAGQHLSNQSQNYVSDLQKGKERNESVWNDVMKEGIFDGPDIDLKKHTKFLSDVREKTLSAGKGAPPVLNFDLPAEPLLSKGNLDNSSPTKASQPGYPSIDEPNPSALGTQEKQSKADVYLQQDKVKEEKALAEKFQAEVALKLSQLDHTVSKGPSFKEQILAIKDPQTAEENFYKTNMNLVLTVVTLKRVIAKLHEENVVLKKQRDEFDVRESEYLTRIRKLENSIDEFRLKEKLWNTKPSEYIKFDLDDLNLKLKNIDESLDKATANNLQERFLEDIVAKNKEYLQRNDENSMSLKMLRDNLGQLKATLITMNQNG